MKSQKIKNYEKYTIYAESVTGKVLRKGKQITVDNIIFPSAGSAAKYICNAEAVAGTTRNPATISKELRRYLQGKRPAWYMYDKYYIC